MPRTTGYSKIDAARLCFQENIRLFANAKQNPEMFNLYNGLQNLASAIEQVQNDLEQIKRALANLQAKP